MNAVLHVLLLHCLLWTLYAISSGKDAYNTGITLTQLGRDEEAAEYFWVAILKSNDNPDDYDIRLAVEAFMGTFKRRQIPEQGLLRIGRQFKSQGQEVEASEYLNTVISMNPNIAEAYLLLGGMQSLDPNMRLKHLISALQIDPDGYKTNYDVASQLWDLRAWDSSLSYFERAFQLNSSCHSSFSTSVYLRQYICKWGTDGILHYADMRAIEQLVTEELMMLEGGISDTDFTTVTVHPHMTLSYDIPSQLKLDIAKSHSRGEKALVKESGAHINTHKPSAYREEAAREGFRIKVGYVSANIKSKTTAYMSQDLFRFHDRSKFEVHVYATTPNDSPQYIHTALNGVNWRAKIAETTEYFHDMTGYNVLQLANFIRYNNYIHLCKLLPLPCNCVRLCYGMYVIVLYRWTYF